MANKKLSKVVGIIYNIKIFNALEHLFEVSITWKGLKTDFLDVVLPVWRPGRYLIFDFSSGIIEFNAYESDFTLIKWKKIDKSTWRLETNKVDEITIKYKVYANEFHLRTRGLNEQHAFVNGSSMLMYSENFRNQPLILKVEPYNDWHVTTGLKHMLNNPLIFEAQNYDELTDSPFEIGNQKDIEFEVEGKKHIISFFGNAKYKENDLIKDFKKIIEKNYEFWGLIPYDKYVFIVHCTEEGGGGTEHINSTVVGIKPNVFENERSYKRFLQLISHEFFHTWNVKQLRPKGLTPYDYLKENYTEELWIAEGGTSYYDSLIILRTGQYSLEDFINEIIKSVEEDRNREGNKVQSLAESSFDAWIKFWRYSASQYKYETNYYTKGANVSLLIDLEIRMRTTNKYSLDFVYREMLKRFPLGKGYTIYDFMQMCNEISSSDFNEFFNNYVYGLAPLEWEKILLYAGLELSKSDNIKIRNLGLTTEIKDNSIFVTSVDGHSFAEKAGFMVGDEVIGIEKEKVNFAQLHYKLESLIEGDSKKLTILRNNKLIDIELVIKSEDEFTYKLTKVVNPTNLQKSIYESWLGVPW